MMQVIAGSLMRTPESLKQVINRQIRHSNGCLKLIGNIDVNPRILGGKPVILGTRIPLRLILEPFSGTMISRGYRGAYPTLKEENIKATVARTIKYANVILKNEDASEYVVT